MADYVIIGGAVVDGTGAKARRADVAITGDRVEAIGDLANVEARHIDAAGCVVCPGFIDIHSHSDFTLLVDPRAQSQIAQGVTAEVIGNCGHGCAPITDSPAAFHSNIYGHTDDVAIDWHTTAEYLDRLSAARPAVNVATLVPNGNLRIAHVPDHSRPSLGEELAAIDADLREGMEAGAFGFSTGLEYPPERHTSETELAALCRTVREFDGVYVPHTRNREVRSVEAVEEAIATARAAELPVHISHIAPRRGGPPDARERILELVDGAAASGVDVTFDTHTRLHGITNLSNAVPAALLDQDASDLASTLRDPAARRRLREYESIISSFGLGGWENVSVFAAPMAPEFEGRAVTEIAGGADPFDAVFVVLAAHTTDMHGVLVVCRSYEEAEIVDTAAHPLCMVGSDATALCVDGPLADSVFLGAYTWAAWYLRQTVRERRVFGIEEAVRRMTVMPAARLGLRGRGTLAPGAFADVAVFDPERITDTGTLEAPNRLAEGVRHVFVNGVPAMLDGTFTGETAGRVIRRGQ